MTARPRSSARSITAPSADDAAGNDAELLDRIGTLPGSRRASAETVRQWLGAFAKDRPIAARRDAEEWLALCHVGAYSSRPLTALDAKTMKRLNRRLVVLSLRRAVRDRLIGAYLGEYSLSDYRRMKARVLLHKLALLEHAVEDGHLDDAEP